MKDRVQSCVTAGVALVGAGVMAVSPVAPQAPEVLRSVNAEVALTAASDNPVDAALRLGQGFGESGVRFAGSLATSPLGLGPIAAALLAGDNPSGQNQALFNALVPYLDGTNYAIDPIIFALDDVLPAPIGQDPSTSPNNMYGSELTRFRADVLLAARDDIDEAVADALGVGERTDVDDEGPIYAAARLGAGFAASGVRAVRSAVTAPLGLVAVAEGLRQSFETGNNTALYKALEAYIDGPNYVVDPIVFAVDDVLPAPVGSDPSTTPNNMGTSEVSKFRANTLLGARDEVRGAVAGVLGVNQNIAGARSLSNVNAGTTKTERPSGPISRIIKSLNASPGAASAESAKPVAKHRAPATGGLSSLFKKKSETTGETAPAPTK